MLDIARGTDEARRWSTSLGPLAVAVQHSTLFQGHYCPLSMVEERLEGGVYTSSSDVGMPCQTK